MVVTLYPDQLASSCLRLSQDIQESGYEPTLLVAVLRGGAEVAARMRQQFPHADYCEVRLTRPGTKQKSQGLMHRMLQRSPRWICNLLREVESRVNSWISIFRKPSRIGTIKLPPAIVLKAKEQAENRILLIDDAIDTGATIAEARQQLLSLFSGAEVRVAVITVTTSRPLCEADYCLFHNHTLCRFPWSGDYRSK